MTDLIVGIDPGANGALATIDSDGWLEVYDLKDCIKPTGSFNSLDPKNPTMTSTMIGMKTLKALKQNASVQSMNAMKMKLIRNNRVRVGITAPKDVPVHRSEIWDAIQHMKQRTTNQIPSRHFNGDEPLKW